MKALSKSTDFSCEQSPFFKHRCLKKKNFKKDSFYLCERQSGRKQENEKGIFHQTEQQQPSLGQVKARRKEFHSGLSHGTTLSHPLLCVSAGSWTRSRSQYLTTAQRGLPVLQVAAQRAAPQLQSHG